MNENPESPSFWDERYQVGKTPWDFHWVPSRLKTFFEGIHGKRVFIPGCGSGHEIAGFLEAGCSVTALDFSASAVAKARAFPGNDRADILQDNFSPFLLNSRPLILSMKGLSSALCIHPIGRNMPIVCISS